MDLTAICGRMWIGCIWLRKGTRSGLLLRF